MKNALLKEIVEELGRLTRITYADTDHEDEEFALLVEEAETLLAECASTLGDWVSEQTLPVPCTDAIDRWLLDPRRSYRAALEAIENLGARASGLRILSPANPAHEALTESIHRVASAIKGTAKTQSGVMLQAALAASRLIAEGGVVPEEDQALLALADVTGLRLQMALCGELLEDVVPLRIKPLDVQTVEQLSEVLRRALDPEQPVYVLADAVELTQLTGLKGSNNDLVLHTDLQSSPTASRPVELLPGVHIHWAHGELEVRLAPGQAELAPGSAIALLPMLQAEFLAPCSSRTGENPEHVLFTLSERTDVDTYALVLGKQAVLVRIQAP